MLLRPPGSSPCRRQKVLLSPSVAARIGVLLLWGRCFVVEVPCSSVWSSILRSGAGPVRQLAKLGSAAYDGVHPCDFSHTHPKAAGRLGTAGDAGPASAAQQCTQCSTTHLADNGRETCAKHGIRPYTARQYRIPPFGGRTRHTTPSFVGATRSTTKGETDAPSAISGPQQRPQH